MSRLRKFTLPVFSISGGARTDGKWVPGVKTANGTIKASVQVATPNDMRTLPEGKRTTQTFLVYCNRELVTELENELEPDETVIFGEPYVVAARHTWQNQIRPSH